MSKGRFMRACLVAAACLAAAPVLNGCIGMLVATGAGTTVMVATDRRSAYMVAMDKVIQQQVEFKIARAYPTPENSGYTQGSAQEGETPQDSRVTAQTVKWRVDATSFNGRLLLVGEVPDQFMRDRVEGIAREVDGVQFVVNEIAVAEPCSSSQIALDALTLSRVKADILATKGVFSHSIKVVVNRNVVYLLGLVTDEEAELVTGVASRVANVVRVVRSFEIHPASDFASSLTQSEGEAKAEGAAQPES